MKVIDLLNKIANGKEVPRKFEYNKIIFIYNDEIKEHFDEKDGYSFNFIFDLTEYEVLNDEIEIIEDTPKEVYIEKLDSFKFNKKILTNEELYLENYLVDVRSKINEIIDKINKGEKNEN